MNTQVAYIGRFSYDGATVWGFVMDGDYGEDPWISIDVASRSPNSNFITVSMRLEDAENLRNELTRAIRSAKNGQTYVGTTTEVRDNE